MLVKISYSYRTSGKYIECVPAFTSLCGPYVSVYDRNLNFVCACDTYLNFNVAPFCSVVCMSLFESIDCCL
jgi:hypothetical protein